MKKLKTNYLAVLVIVVLGQIIPATWYGMWADKWMVYNNLTLEQAEGVGAAPYITSIITSITFALVLAWVFRRMNIESVVDGLVTALIMGVPFSLMNHMTVNMFSIRPYGLSWIEGGGDLIIWAVAGLVLGGWRKYEEADGA